MGTVNRMTNLLDKIERRLGVTYLLEFDDKLNKDEWVKVILADTMDTFSRFLPNRIVINLNGETCKFDNGRYLINEELLDPLDIIGVGDIVWNDMYMNNKYNSLSGGVYDQFMSPMGPYDVGLVQMSADISSLFNIGVYVEFEEPNILCVKGVNHRDVLRGFKDLPLNIFIKHKSLITISPTKMELFERLAISDVAKYLIGQLKYFDGYETNYGNIDLKLEDLRDEAGKRDQIIDELEAGYVNPGNKFQPIMMTI